VASFLLSQLSKSVQGLHSLTNNLRRGREAFVREGFPGRKVDHLKRGNQIAKSCCYLLG
jgi:hypothetical protein